VLSTTELTFLHQNFTIAGGGTFTVRNVGGTGVYIRWSTRVLVTPVCGKASANYYELICPTSGTIGTGQVNTSDGIFLGAPGSSYAALYYVLPTTQTADNTAHAAEVHVQLGTWQLPPHQLPKLNNILPTYVLVAQTFSDTSKRVRDSNW
jgi:hypothetical protein